MLNDYALNPITELIVKVRPDKDSDAKNTIRIRWLNALFVYFQYAVASVRQQEENIDKMGENEHRNFATRVEYADCQTKIYSDAIAAYLFMRTCLNVSLSIIETISSQKQNSEFKEFRKIHRPWVKDLVKKRDIFAGHPEKYFVWKP